MGMDVYGKNGNYFRANVWSWRPLMMLMEKAGGEAILGDDIFNGMSYNDGKGALTQEQCEKLANAIEQIKEEIEGEWYDPIELDMPDFQITASGQLAKEDHDGETHSPYRCHIDHIEELVTFLRECGSGFEVW